MRVIRNLFSKNPANVLVDGFLSPEFTINRGVLQGSKLGPILFNLVINNLLNDLRLSKLGATVGPVHIPALGFADDIVLISDKPWKLQRMITIASSWARTNSMAFNITKCKVMILNWASTQVRFTLDETVLDIVSTHRYLGVTLSSRYVTNLFKDHFQSILQRARTKAAAIRGLGFSKNGLRIKSSIKLYKLQVRPLLEFCAQSFTYAAYSQPFQPNAVGCFAKELEHLQTQILKTLINCPRSTSPAVVRLFCGTEPLACRLEILKLRYFWRKLNGPADAISSKILKYRRDRVLECTRGFAHEVFNICIKYNTMNTWHGLAPQGTLNRILNPLQYFKRIIISHNLCNDLEDGRTRNCFFSKNFLSNPFRYQKNYHIIQPFSQSNCFSSPNCRKRLSKLFYTRALTLRTARCVESKPEIFVTTF